MSKDDSNSEERKVTNIWIAFGLAFLLVVVLYFIFVLTNAENFSEVTAEGFSGFGAFVGGVGGTLFSAIAAGLVYMAYSTQKKELANSVKALTETQRNQELQSNLAALNPIMENIEKDFNKPLIAWFNNAVSRQRADEDLTQGRAITTKKHSSYVNNNRSLSEIQPFNPDNVGVADPLLDELAGSISQTNYNGEKTLRFFITQFSVRVTAAMKIVVDMNQSNSASHFYYSPALVLQEVSNTLDCVFDRVFQDDELPTGSHWYSDFVNARSQIEGILKSFIEN